MITLVIIGVIAAITVPTLITKYQKEQTGVRVKKAYSELSQAIHSAEKTYGTIDTWDLSDFPTAQDRIAYFTNNYLKPNLKIIKICNPTSSDCWASQVRSIDNLLISSWGGDTQNATTPRASLISASGYSLYYWLHNSGTGGWFFIDINGPSQKPNRLGRDIFPFVMNWGKQPTNKIGCRPGCLHYNPIPTRDEIINGSNTIKSEMCKKGTNKSMAGQCCTALLAIDNWQIKDDYPW